MDDSPPLQLTQTAPDRDAVPKAGLNSALGDAFLTQGVRNGLVVGDFVLYADRHGPHHAIVTCYDSDTQTYEVLLAERQIECDSIEEDIRYIRVGDTVRYTKGDVVDIAVVSKVCLECAPPFLFVQIARRGVSEARLRPIVDSLPP